MRLTSFTDYGIRALMRLAGEPDRLFTTEEIAREFGISRHHLMKVVRKLSLAGVVATQKGASGGFRLAKPAEEFTLGEIIRRLESDQALVECFRVDGGTCVLTPRCSFRARLSAAREAFLRELDRSTLADCAWRPARRPVAPTA
ncbi:MAG TPA: Rrf2 family transcriptional regulator [Steroidobacteraceae bacterium]|jgi:Rrf2 family nitric oxide-sensitive transcriptional repressor|nr:Rrf2 family transcriptional regulator [Steroidobacteraceae bacterium]